MSEPQDLSLDLEKAFLPSWAQQPTDPNRYARFEGGEGERRGRGDFGDRGGSRGPRQNFGGPRPGGPRPGGPRGFGDRGPRPSGPPPGTPRSSAPRPGGPGPGGQGGPGAPNLAWDPNAGGQGDRGGFRGRRGDRGDRGDRPHFEDRRPEPLIPVDVTFVPEPGGVTSLARQIRLSARAYPLFEVAGLVIQKPDRFDSGLRVLRGKDGKPQQPLFVCSLDETVWLSEDEAMLHVLATQFDTFYATEKIATEAPKGVYTFVAQCGFSGEILGPPNYHGYQEKLRRIHAERFGRMPFEMYKARVRIVKDEAVVKQWLESQSFKTEYTTLNEPEPKRLASRADVENHFRETHLPNLVRSVDSIMLKRDQFARLPQPLQALLRVATDRERRFPIRIATALSTAFANAGLQFFKRDKTIVHVAVARPHHLDMEAQVVSDGVKRIISHIQANPKCTRRQLLDSLAPLPAAAVAPAAPAPETVPAEGTAAPAPAPEAPRSSPEREAVLTDLHWLLHQGHVIEFGTGQMELSQKPAARPEPPKTEPRAGAKPPEGPRKEKGPRQDRTPWPRKTGLQPITVPGYPPYSPLPQLSGI